MNPCELGAAHAARKIREQRMTSEMLVHSCLAQIDAREAQVQAWAHLNDGHALALARRADTLQRSGAQLGPLHGVPIGIKDIFDTADFPTEFGSPIFRDRQPESDAAVVERLRAAGAIILVGILALFFGREISAPLGRLAKRADALSLGLSKRRQAPSDHSLRGNEIGRLNIAFERMEQRIAEDQRQLRG